VTLGGVPSLVSGVLAGDVRALARACRAVDDRLPGHRDLLRALYPHTGRAWILGVTGNPGAGKSTLTDRLVEAFRRENARVGVIAVDPTSPFSGGAILGDRIRMQRHFEDAGVFIRSVATRGAVGGLSRSVSDLVRVLDAWGAGVVVVETVGVGQDELDITRRAHTTLVVVAPGLGDDIQAIKAGILECADVFAVNKADRAGAEATVRDLENMLALGDLSLGTPSISPGHGAARARATATTASDASATWVPPVIKTVAVSGDGVDALVDALRKHRRFGETTEAGRSERRRRMHAEFSAMLRDALVDSAVARLGDDIEKTADKIAAREVDPYDACDQLLNRFGS
jgi:LAO/AO transport system kinase